MTNVDLDDLVLETGSHGSPEQGMNVLEAVSVWGHREFSDRPNTVSPVITAFLREFNDAVDKDTRQRLKPLIPKFDRSVLSRDIEDFRAWKVTDWLVRVLAPLWLKAAGLEELAEPLESSPPILNPDQAREIQDKLDDAAGAARSMAKEGTAAWNAAGDEAWASVGQAQWNSAGTGVKAAVKNASGCIAGPAYAAAGEGLRYAARDAAAEVACDVTWDCAYIIAWKGAVPVGGAEPGAASEAARKALAPTMEKAMDEAFGLLEMLVETRRVPKEQRIDKELKLQQGEVLG